MNIIKNALTEAQKGLSDLLASKDTLECIEKTSELIANAFKDGNKLISFGNGGSHCDAMHLAEELTGRFRNDRKALPAMAISDPSHISCVANDFGFEHVFSRFIEAHGNQKDIVVGISTSGTSKNVIEAFKQAKNQGCDTILLTGSTAPDSSLIQYSDHVVATPAGRYADRVQELHIKVIHIWIELIEKKLGFTQ